MSGSRKIYQRELQDILSEQGVDPSRGLNRNDAEDRLKNHGANKLRETKKRSIWSLILSQVNNPVIYLLLAAMILAFFFSDTEAGIAIAVVILLNTTIGFWMELQAQQSMKTLREMDKIQTPVLREGIEEMINAEKLVPGDILLIKPGIIIPADARLIESSDLQVDESALTGESIPVNKSKERIKEEVSLGERKNIIYKGTSVTDGKGKAIVIGTGMNTEMGNISRLVEEAGSEEVPLNKKLEKLTKRLIFITIGLAASFFLAGYLVGKDAYDLVQTAIAWTIAAIPEGLPIVATIALAKGMLKLADKQVIVKKLSAIETLGETTVIFSDKTGTLTLNKLFVSTFQFPDQRVQVDISESDKKINYYDENGKELKKIRSDSLDFSNKILGLCNNARLNDGDPRGDPLEIASLQYVRIIDQDLFNKLMSMERKGEDPFDSNTMMMATVHENKKDGYLVSAKGAAEKLLEKCTRVLKKGGNISLDDEAVGKWKEKNLELAKNGLRTLALAYREVDEMPEKDRMIEDMILVGLIGFRDPSRKEVKQAIDLCHQAGIEVVMVTGDHPATAEYIARDINIVDEKDPTAVKGQALKKEDKEGIISKRIFARVDPGQKLKIIEKFQQEGEIVAMTGDGVNDAPALKKADIGIAMGKRGTQVAQEAADMVLRDDAFNSIVEAIRNGRIIFGNIRRFIVYQLSYHLAEILIIAGISFSVFYLPLLPLQLLFLNLLSDVFPALALGIGPGNPHIMSHPPYSKEKPIVPKEKWMELGLYGIIIAMAITGTYFYAYYAWGFGPDKCNNIAFFSLALTQLWHVFNMRESDEPVVLNQITRNKYIWLAILLCLSALAAAYFIPTLKEVLSFQDMDLRSWGLILLSSFLPLVVIQAIKMFQNQKNSRS